MTTGSANHRASPRRPNGRPRLHEASPLESRIQVILTQAQVERIDRFCALLLTHRPGLLPVPTRGAVIRSALEWFVVQAPKLHRGAPASALPAETSTYHTKVRLTEDTAARLEAMRGGEEQGGMAGGAGAPLSRAALVRHAVETYLDAQEAASGRAPVPFPVLVSGGGSTTP